MVNSGIKRNDNDLVRRRWHMLQRNIEKVPSFVREILSFAKGNLPKAELISPYAIALEIVNFYKDATKNQE